MLHGSPPGLSSPELTITLAELSVLTGVPVRHLHALARACRAPIRRDQDGVKRLRWADVKGRLDFQRLSLLRAQALGQAVADPPAKRTVADDPHLVSQWHTALNGELYPYQISQGANRKVWWRCARGPDHVWSTSVAHRREGSDCPFCANRRVSVTNSLQSHSPALVREWHPKKNASLTPAGVMATSERKVHWKCPEAPDHEWCAPVVSRFRDGHGCPMCQNRRASSSNSLAVRFPEIAAEWHPTRNGSQRADQTVCGSTLPYWWKCPVADDHEWQMPVQLRTVRGAGCPFCNNRRLSSTNHLLACSAALAQEWHPVKNGALRPSGVIAVSRTKVWWKCPEGPDHEWRAPVAERFERGIGCPMCASKRVSLTNSLAYRHPNLVAEWHPTKNGDLRPLDVVAGTDRKAWWKCPNGPDHEWQADIASRTRKFKRPAGCPFCTGQRPSAQTSLAARYPEIAREWHPTLNKDLTPDGVTYGSKRRVWWQCPKVIYHVWEARVHARTTQRGGCRYCAGLGPPDYRD
jgi:hypothetical protein